MCARISTTRVHMRACAHARSICICIRIRIRTRQCKQAHSQRKRIQYVHKGVHVHHRVPACMHAWHARMACMHAFMHGAWACAYSHNGLRMRECVRVPGNAFTSECMQLHARATLYACVEATSCARMHSHTQYAQVHEYGCLCAHLRICTHIYMNACLLACMPACMHARTVLCIGYMCTCACAYANMHTAVHECRVHTHWRATHTRIGNLHIRVLRTSAYACACM